MTLEWDDQQSSTVIPPWLTFSSYYSYPFSEVVMRLFTTALEMIIEHLFLIEIMSKSFWMSPKELQKIVLLANMYATKCGCK